MDKHLENLSLVQKRLVKAYATTIMGEVRTVEDVVPAVLKPYVELEIAEREIEALASE